MGVAGLATTHTECAKNPPTKMMAVADSAQLGNHELKEGSTSGRLEIVPSQAGSFPARLVLRHKARLGFLPPRRSGFVRPRRGHVHQLSGAAQH